MRPRCDGEFYGAGETRAQCQRYVFRYSGMDINGLCVIMDFGPNEFAHTHDRPFELGTGRGVVTMTGLGKLVVAIGPAAEMFVNART